MPEYFENCHRSYRQHIDCERPVKAIDAALELLAARKKAAGPIQYTMDHKGTPFYNMGYAAFASHDYPSASLYFDAAVAADLLYHKDNHDTPALRFMQLRTVENENLLAANIIAEIIESMNKLLDDYNKRDGATPFTLDELRTRFLRKIITADDSSERTLVTALLSFVAEWPYRAKQIDLVEAGSREPFFLHLLRGCVLFESLLKEAPGTQEAPGTRSLETLGEALRYHACAIGTKNIKTSEKNFNNVLKSLVCSMPMKEAITTCAKSRNTVGHNLVWATTDLTRTNYDFLVKNIAASCLHAISKLYP